MSDDTVTSRTKEIEFGQRLNSVLSPSRAIESAELLRGRSDQLDDIRRALYSPGRQLFIYGHRGVGKTSLGHTVAFEQQSSDGKPIFLACAGDTTCFDVVRQIGETSIPTDKKIMKKTVEEGIRIGAPWAGYEFKKKLEQGAVPSPTSLGDCSNSLSSLPRLIPSSRSSLLMSLIELQTLMKRQNSVT
jgi:uncharacterized protein